MTTVAYQRHLEILIDGEEFVLGTWLYCSADLFSAVSEISEASLGTSGGVGKRCEFLIALGEESGERNKLLRCSSKI